jgi:hypothetical protein
MADPVTLLAIRTRVYALADLENAADFASTTVVNDLINQSLAELYDIMRSAYGQEYWRKSTTLTTVAGTSTYSLPADFLSLLYAEYVIGTSERVRLTPYNIHNATRIRNSGVWSNIDPIYYRLGMRTSATTSETLLMEFLPTPTGVYSVEVYYVPTMKELSGDTHVVDAVSGWEDYAVWDVVASLLQKEESDASFAIMKRDNIRARIEALAGNRDQGSPEYVSDVEEDYRLPPWW